MRAFWALTVLRTLDVLRSRSSAAFVLVFPVLLLTVIGFVFREGHPFERRTVLVVDGPGTHALAARLEAFSELRVEQVQSLAEGVGRLRVKMVSAVLVACTTRECERAGASHRVLIGSRDRIFGRGLRDTLPASVMLVPIDAPRWGYVQYLFPGVLAFSVMLSGLFATAYTMVLYRQNQFLKKLATTPMPKLAFVLAQVAGRSVLVVGQLGLLVIAGVVLFDVPLSLPGAIGVLGISLAGLVAFMGIGFVLACVIQTEDLVVDLVSAVNLPIVFLSEVFFPLSALPRPLAAIGELLPSTAMVRLVRAVLLYGGVDPTQLAWGLAQIGIWTVVTFAVGLRLFRWHR